MKGVKDRIDIMTMLCCTDMNFNLYRQYLEKYKQMQLRQRLKEIVKSCTDIKYLPLSFKELIKVKRRVLQEI